jgi:peptidoglycan/LPS O-acetylase OafA/YrhL
MGAVRLFLALVVAADHWRTLVLDPREIVVTQRLQLGFNASYAVMFFYIISGFLITYTLTENYERSAQGLVAFYRNRIARIFSLYWPLVIVAFVAHDRAWSDFTSAGTADQVTGIFLLGIDWRIGFADYPHEHWQAAITGLHQSWTLGAELVFYLAAPFLVRSWKIGVAILGLSLAIRAAFVAVLGNDLHPLWTYLFLPSTAAFFMLGHLSCVAARHWPRVASPAVGLPLLGLALLLLEFGPRDGFDGARFWLATLLFTVSLPGVFAATKDRRAFNRLGDLSYPVYLVHNLALVWSADAIIGVVAPAAGTNGIRAIVTIAAFLAVTVAAAAAAHLILERPISHVMRARARRVIAATS